MGRKNHKAAVPFKALDVTQIQIAEAKAPVAVVIRQSDQPSGHLIVLSIEFTLVAVARLADAKRHTGNPYANASICDHLLGHLPSARSGYLIELANQLINDRSGLIWCNLC